MKWVGGAEESLREQAEAKPRFCFILTHLPEQALDRGLRRVPRAEGGRAGSEDLRNLSTAFYPASGERRGVASPRATATQTLQRARRRSLPHACAALALASSAKPGPSILGGLASL